MTEHINLGGGHCCVCSQVCGHIGGPWYCQTHNPQTYGPPTGIDPMRELRLLRTLDDALAERRADLAFRDRLRERIKEDRALLDAIERDPGQPWRDAYEQEAAKFQAETITTSFLARRLVENEPSCDSSQCPEKGESVYVGPGQSRMWLCRVHASASGTHATGALVSTETLIEACRTLGECTPDFCAGASEAPTCRFCQRLDIEEPCLLDPIRQEHHSA